MKLSGARAESFVRAGVKNQIVILLHGPDAGRISEYAARLVKSVVDDPGDPFRVVSFTPKDLSAEPGALADAVNAMALGGGRRAVRVRGAAEAAADAVKAALEGGIGDGVVIIEAGELNARSKLRKLCESHDRAAAVGCYADDAAGKAALVDEIVSGFGLTIARDARAMAVDLLGPDRAANRAELEKLCLYAIDSTSGVSPEDVAACLTDSGEAQGGDAALGAFAGRMDALTREFDRFEAEGGSAAGLLRQSIRLAERFLEARRSIDNGAQAMAAVDALRPPVFFKIKNDFARIARAWPREKILDALDILAEGERATRTAGGVDRACMERCFFRITQMGRKLCG
ncbi:MAG: DNA polymerase III subunit delta [Rhodospirillales bacterium]